MSEVINLPRGGYVVDTPAGYIQFGSPPETIKDTMSLPKGVPQIIVLPDRFFNWIKGISVAEVEFPLYYNFFLKKRKTYIICQPEQYKRFTSVLSEAVFGPGTLDLVQDCAETVPPEDIPDIGKEIAFFRGGLNLSDLVRFVVFKNNSVTLNGVSLQLFGDGSFHIHHDGKEIAKVPSKIDYVPTYDIGERPAEPFEPPLFGVTCLGSSHGFDPTENTSGFIVWINGRGIMVDPPVNTAEWLVDSNVSPKLTDTIILTHCHADHDAGTLQKILQEGKVSVYTTKTVMESFLRKYSAFTDVSPDYLMQLFDFHRVSIGKPLFIHGGRFSFFYTLHSIPTIGFTVEYDGKNFVYSSDHNNDPSLHEKLFSERVISEKRYHELRNFPWEADFIYHEAGIPPLHTPVAFLDSLDDGIRKKTTVYHIAKKDFPAETPLTMAETGIEHTLTVPARTPAYGKWYHILGLLQYLDFFRDMPISKAQEFLSIVREESYKRGETIIQKGTRGEKFYIIKTGNIAVLGEDLKQRKIYGPYDYFGEVALLTGKPRAADVVAETGVTLYTIGREEFLHFIENTELKRTLKRLAQVRDSETWNVLSTSPFFRILTSTQKTFLESLLHSAEIKKPGTIIKKGETLDRIYIVRKGTVDVFDGEEKVATLGRGDFLGAMGKLHRGEPAEYTFTSSGPGALYYIEREDVLTFLNNNPGLIMKLVYDFLPD
jgi:CRP-like cAMP-binding protein